MATTHTESSPGARPRGRFRAVNAERYVACAIAFLSALRIRLPLDVPVGVAVSAVVLPVTVVALLRYRGAFSVGILCAAAAVSGIILTSFAYGFAPTDMRMLASNVVQVLGLGLVLAALLWARTVVGSRSVILAYGLGALLSVAGRGINLDNPWKSTFSVPVILIVLSLPWVYRNRWPQAVACGVLCAVSMLNDSRSLAGMLLIALLLTVTQGVERRSAGGSRVVLVVARIVVMAVAGFLLVQAAILEGLLGEGVQLRTEAQIATSGSALAGGRPEMGAATALLGAQPLGFGSGTLPTSIDVLIAKEGMSALGYDPNNGYVTNYMFGYGFEVHSVLGDLWLLHGLPGAALVLTIVIFAVYGLSRSLATGLASAIMVFLTLRLLWDLPFSPFDSAMTILPLALAMVLPVKRLEAVHRSRREEDLSASHAPRL